MSGAKYMTCPECEASFPVAVRLPLHRFLGKVCPGSGTRVASNPPRRAKRSAEFSGYLQQDGTLLDFKGLPLGTWRLNRILKAYRPPAALDYLTDRYEAVEFRTKRGQFAGGLSMGVGMLVRLTYLDGGALDMQQQTYAFAEACMAQDAEEAAQQDEASEQ